MEYKVYLTAGGKTINVEADEWEYDSAQHQYTFWKKTGNGINDKVEVAQFEGICGFERIEGESIKE